ncbi:hypothetical protein [Microbacterium sp. NPDC091662]|uniref:AbiTii domain-containing protein n=1 Tax=Microbacterium sp. NPDC091662 TaxID=3364211 RepID=UPI0038009FBF
MGKNTPGDLLGQIERDLLAEKPLDSLLRKLVLLGGSAGSAELREWASSELRGYDNDEELPRYRTITAPLQIDGAVPGGIIRNQSISPMDLPDFARDDVTELVRLQMGIREIRSMIDRHQSDQVVKLLPPGSSSLVGYMNRSARRNGQISDLYWSVSIVALDGVLDQVRTRLAELIAEMRAATPHGQTLPTGAQATNAVNLVIRGRGNRVTIAQTVETQPKSEGDPVHAPRFWTRARTIGASVVGLATIVGTIAAVLPLV